MKSRRSVRRKSPPHAMSSPLIAGPPCKPPPGCPSWQESAVFRASGARFGGPARHPPSISTTKFNGGVRGCQHCASVALPAASTPRGSVPRPPPRVPAPSEPARLPRSSSSPRATSFSRRTALRPVPGSRARSHRTTTSAPRRQPRATPRTDLIGRSAPASCGSIWFPLWPSKVELFTYL